MTPVRMFACQSLRRLLNFRWAVAIVLTTIGVAGANAAQEDAGALDEFIRSMTDARAPLDSTQAGHLKVALRTWATREWLEGNRKRLPEKLFILMEAWKLTREHSIIPDAVRVVDAMMARAIPPAKAHVCPYTGKRTPYAFQTKGPVDIVGVAFNYAAMARAARTIVEHPELHRLPAPSAEGRATAADTCLDRARAYLDRGRLVNDYFLNESGWWNRDEKRWSYQKLKATSRLTDNGGYVAFNRYLMFDLSRWDTARALKVLDAPGDEAWIEKAHDVVSSGIELWKKALIFKDHPKGRYAIFPYRITRRMEDTNHISWDLFPLAFFFDDGLAVGRDNLRAVSNALVHIAIDEGGRPTRGIDGTATDGKGWRRHLFNTHCLVIANAAPDIFERRAGLWLERIKETLKADRMTALYDFTCLLVFQSRYLDGKRR